MNSALVLALAALMGVSAAADANPQQYGYGVDLVRLAQQQDFQCLRNYGYTVAFLRIYGPNGDGQGDRDGIQNVKNAYAANLGFEVFVSPSTSGYKNGNTQFDEAYRFAKDNGLKLNRIWLQVTAPILWNKNINVNRQFIKDFIQAARSAGITIGIYTNWYDVEQIVGPDFRDFNNGPLWYWHANGYGHDAATSTDFQDFTTFSSFGAPTVKQNSLSESVCNVYVNKNVFATQMFPHSNASPKVMVGVQMPTAIGQGAQMAKTA